MSGVTSVSRNSKYGIRLMFLGLQIYKRLVKKIFPVFILLALVLMMPSQHSDNIVLISALVLIAILTIFASLKIARSILAMEIPVVKFEGSSTAIMEYRDATLQINLMRISLPKALRAYSVMILDKKMYVALSKNDFELISNRLQQDKFES